MAAPDSRPVDLSDYVDVAERIRLFFTRYPDGSLQASLPELVEIDGKRFLQVTVSAYRTPGDPRPAIASAWEVWPGRTPFTHNTEAMNAETSAAGRALAFLGLSVRRVATADDVRNRQEPPPLDKVKLARVRSQLNKHAATNEAKQDLIELIVGHEVGALNTITAGELDQVHDALEALTVGRTRLELDEQGAARIVDSGGDDAT